MANYYLPDPDSIPDWKPGLVEARQGRRAKLIAQQKATRSVKLGGFLVGLLGVGLFIAWLHHRRQRKDSSD